MIFADRELLDTSYLQVVGEERTYTRRDLHLYATWVAEKLPANQTDLIVGIQHTHPFYLLATMLACWSKGLGITPLAENLPANYLKELYQHNVELLLSENAIDDCLIENLPLPAHDEIDDHTVELTQNNHVDEISGDALAIVIFSSGSTGKPKAIPLSINNIKSNIQGINAHLNLSKETTYICTSPLFYAHGLYNSLLTSYWCGNPLLFSYPFDAFSSNKLIKFLAQTTDTYLWHVTPSMVKILLHTLARKKKLIGKLNIEKLIVGTSPLPPEEKNEISQLLQCQLYQQYGMSECLFICCNSGTDDKTLGKVLVGEIAIRNSDDSSAGEVWIKSPSAFGSYFNQPEYDSAYDVKGWFKTGDLGFIDPEGRLTLTGRASRMIKKGGLTIYPESIEKILLKHESVSEAVVIGYKDTQYGENINAFVVSENKNIDDQRLREHCLQHIADNQLPEKFQLVDSIPKLANGKIDLKHFEKNQS